jgi:protein O-mannosyl-transferase
MAKRSPKKKRPSGTGPTQGAQTREIPSAKSGSMNWKVALMAMVIVAAGLWIYWPALHGDWLMDDDVYITQNPVLRDPNGLWKMWFLPGTLIEYYPMAQSVQWFEWQLWGSDTFGYHLVNVILHLMSALLVWRLLDKFNLRLAWLGGLLFAVHPQQVESVAWISELKNTLSLPFFLLSMCAWIDYEERHRPGSYLWAAGLFLVAMLCKISMAPFPFVILFYAWWRRGRIRWSDFTASAPFFLISLTLGIISISAGNFYSQLHNIQAPQVPLGGFFSRLALTGLSMSFYLWKSIWPVQQLLIYPQWRVDPPSLLQFLPWPILCGVIYWSWKRRQSWGRHVLLGLGFFLINLAPFLGFMVVSYMEFTWVMDHFLYLPLIGLIGLAVAGMEQIDGSLAQSVRPCAMGAVAIVLGLLAFGSRGYAAQFITEETAWRHTAEGNPEAWMAHNNLGNALARSGQFPEAMEQYQDAIAILPGYADPHSNIGNILQQEGRFSEAIEQYKQALQINPNFADAHNNLGNAFYQTGRISKAMEEYEEALRINPNYTNARINLEKLQALQKAP